MTKTVHVKNVHVTNLLSGRNENAIAQYVIVRSVIQTGVSVMTMHKNLEVFVNVEMDVLVIVTVVMIALIRNLKKGATRNHGGYSINYSMYWSMYRTSMCM